MESNRSIFLFLPLALMLCNVLAADQQRSLPSDRDDLAQTRRNFQLDLLPEPADDDNGVEGTAAPAQSLFDEILSLVTPTSNALQWYTNPEKKRRVFRYLVREVDGYADLEFEQKRNLIAVLILTLGRENEYVPLVNSLLDYFLINDWVLANPHDEEEIVQKSGFLSLLLCPEYYPNLVQRSIADKILEIFYKYIGEHGDYRRLSVDGKNWFVHGILDSPLLRKNERFHTFIRNYIQPDGVYEQSDDGHEGKIMFLTSMLTYNLYEEIPELVDVIKNFINSIYDTLPVLHNFIIGPDALRRSLIRSLLESKMHHDNVEISRFVEQQTEALGLEL